MPKLKTHSGAKKRLKISKKGKVIRGPRLRDEPPSNGASKTASPSAMHAARPLRIRPA